MGVPPGSDVTRAAWPDRLTQQTDKASARAVFSRDMDEYPGIKGY
jgi:hypothetical protein